MIQLISIPLGYEEKDGELVKTKEFRKTEILQRLNEIDAETIRPLRAKLAGVSTEEDETKLIELETEAEKLREELSSLGII